ncbi:MAG: EthD domain-containing protein [Pseudomonadota bacterium]
MSQRSFQSNNEFAIASNEPQRLADFTRELGGVIYEDPRERWEHLPFRALASVTCDTREDLDAIADVGLYVVCRRAIKAGAAPWVGLFPMRHRSDRSHAQCDAHWRDKHGPLALEQHRFMSSYHQLSVVATLSGPTVDGFALCGFDSEADLRERFYSEPGGERIIAADVGQFADPRRSPRRLIAQARYWYDNSA